MTNSDELKSILDRIADDRFTEADIATLRRLLGSGDRQIELQLGKYNVNIGEGREIHIGDRIYQGANAEAIQQVFQKVLDAHRLRTLLTHNEFAERVKRAALTSHQGDLVGRETIRQQLQRYLDETPAVIILHGSGGLGKTRLLLALPALLPPERSLWYVRNEAESVEPDIVSLNRETQHIIVVDDAHRFSLLDKLREVIVNPELAEKVTLILATRSIFKDSLIQQLEFPGDRVETIEVQPLENQDINQILQNPPHSIADSSPRHAIVRIAEGNPLFAGITAKLYHQGIALTNLTRDRVLTDYLHKILQDLSKAGGEAPNSERNYLRYLQVLAALGTVNLEDQELQSKIHEVVGISSIDEERIVSRLVEAGLVERYWKTLKIASEVLADYILVQHFFDPKIKQADYQKQIIEPFFNIKPQEVLTNLAEAEVKGESKDAGLLLGQKLDELRQLLDREGNRFRLNLLRCLHDLAYLKPDDILLIVNSIVNGPELPPELIQSKFWGSYEIKHEGVLDEVVELLQRTIYRGGLNDSITLLHSLSFYQIENPEYRKIREKSSKALIAIAEFTPHKSYNVHFLILDRIDDWLKQDFLTHFPLSLALIQPMLNIDLHSAETHPIKPHAIVVHQGSLEIEESLRKIRDRALEILYAAYRKVQDLPTRLQIVRVLCEATYYSNPQEPISSQTREQLESDCTQIACFFDKTVIPSGEFPILERVEEWWWQAKKFHKYRAAELDDLQRQLRNHKGYQLYCLLIGSFGRYRWDDEDEQIDWEEAEQQEINEYLEALDRQKQQKINEYLEALSSSTLEQAIWELEEITRQAYSTGKNEIFGLDNFLRNFGQIHPNLTQQFIEQTIAGNLELRQYLGSVLAGMRSSDRERARGYVQSWLAENDSVLWVAIAQSYRFIDWRQPQIEKEWDVLRQLAAKQSSLVDMTLFQPIQQLAPHNPDLAVELLKTLAARGDEPILRQVAETVSWQMGSRGKWAVPFDNPQDLLEIIQKFERLPYLNSEAEKCLKRLVDINPMQVIDSIERRIKARAKRDRRDGYYQAFPKHFFPKEAPSRYFLRAFDDIKSKPEYPAFLRRVRDWMLQDNFLLQFEAPDLLKELALNLEGELYGVLMEWVESGEVNKLKAVARILRKFNSGESFYKLSREIIVRTQDKSVLSSIKAAISDTPGAIVGSAEVMSNFTQQRIEEVSPWLKDVNLQVRAFAQERVRSLESTLEREKARERLEERSW